MELKIKNISLIIIFILLSICKIPGQNLQWVNSWKGNDFSGGKSVVIDKNKNIYSTGTFRGTLIIGLDTLISKGGDDIFVLKINNTGQLVWIASLGSKSPDVSTDIVIDKKGDILVTGSVSDSLYVGKNLYLTASPNPTAFIAKYDSSGNFKNISYVSNSFYSIIHDLEVEDDNSLVMTGEFNGLFIKDSVSLSNSAGKTFFLVKTDSSGFFRWGKLCIGSGNFGSDVVIGKDAYYVTGSYGKNAFFDNTQLASHSIYHSLFVASYSKTGILQWIKTQTGAGETHGYAISLNNNGKLLVAGEFATTEDTIPLTTFGGYDLLLLEYDESGHLIWYQQQGGVNNDSPTSVSTDGNDFFISGNFSNQALFSDTIVQAKGINAGFIERMNDYGKLKWFRQLGGTSTVENKNIYWQNGNIAVTGDFYENFIIDKEGVVPQDTLFAIGSERFFCVLFSDTVKSVSPLSIEKIYSNRFQIYPNPSAGIIYIQLPERESAPEIIIQDVLGRIVLQRKYKDIQEDAITVMLDEKIENGIYFISVADGKNIFSSEKFVINRK